MIDINNLSIKEIETQLPFIDGVSESVAQKVAAHAQMKIRAGKVAFESKEELASVLKAAKLNSRYMPGVMSIFGVSGNSASELKSVNQLTGRLPNFPVEKMASEMTIDLPLSMRKFKKPEAVEISKPNSKIHQIQSVHSQSIASRLCEINNLPEIREEPIKVFNPIPCNINFDDFNGGAPLDNYERANLAGIDFRKAIHEFIQSYGEERYQYSQAYSGEGLSNFMDEAYTVSDYYNFVVEKGKYFFLYGATTSNILKDFRSKYLGWGTKGNFSLYNLDEVQMAIRKMPEVFSEIKTNLRSLLPDLSQLSADLNSVVEPNMDENLSLLDFILDRTSGYASQDETSSSNFLYYRNKNKVAGSDERLYVDSIPIRDAFTDSFLAKKIAEGLNIEELNAQDKSDIFRVLRTIRNYYVKYENLYGPEWNVSKLVLTHNNITFEVERFKVRKEFLPFLHKLRAALLTANNPNSEEYALYQEKRNKITQQIEAVRAVSGFINSGLLNEEIISKVMAELSSAVTIKKYMSDFLSHAIMVEDDDKEVFLVTPPENRLHNILDYSPGFALVTEFSLEILHQRFGFGKHLYSESLFPGEEVTLDVISKSKKNVEITTTSSEKIFEQANEKTSSDFQSQINKELNESYNKNRTSSRTTNISANASYGGFFGLNASSNSQTTSSETINNTAKKVSNVSDKLAKELSDQRQITFEKSTTEKSIYTTEEENKTTRKFLNINKERTLTFNFFQITREYQNTLYLNDIELLYSSGKFNFATVFINVDSINLLEDNHYVSGIRGLSQFLNKVTANSVQTVSQLIDYKVIRKLPSEFSDNFEEGAVLVVYSLPYSETIPMSQANTFLANVFKPNSTTQKEINNQIWMFVGNGTVSPDGIGVAAFPFSQQDVDANMEWPETNDSKSPESEILNSGYIVVADALKVKIGGKEYNFNLPNLDLCFNKVMHFRTRYVSTSDTRNTLPLPVMQKNYVINTNGVYCENMMGNCGALEEYATEHRKLEVEARKLEVKKLERMLPPDIELYKKNGEVDFDTYSKAVEQYEKVVKAWNEEPKSS